MFIKLFALLMKMLNTTLSLETKLLRQSNKKGTAYHLSRTFDTIHA